MLMFVGQDSGGVSGGGDSGIFGSNGFFAKAANWLGGALETGAEFIAGLPNEIIDFGRSFGGRIFGGASSAADRVQEPFEREGREFVEREAGIRGVRFLTDNSLLILAAIVGIVFFIGRR